MMCASGGVCLSHLPSSPLSAENDGEMQKERKMEESDEQKINQGLRVTDSWLMLAKAFNGREQHSVLSHLSLSLFFLLIRSSN